MRYVPLSLTVPEEYAKETMVECETMGWTRSQVLRHRLGIEDSRPVVKEPAPFVEPVDPRVSLFIAIFGDVGFSYFRFDHLEEVLESLDSREAHILRLYFGLDGKTHTLKELGEDMGLSAERIRQIKSKALSRLRRAPRSRKLLYQVGEEFTHVPEGFNKETSIEELEISCRSYNCLKDSGIQTIGDLLLRTEEDLSFSKNFGKKSLKEIVSILRAMGLSLKPKQCPTCGAFSAGMVNHED